MEFKSDKFIQIELPLSYPKPFFHLDDPDLRIMFGMFMKEDMSPAEKTETRLVLMQKILDSGIQLCKLGEQQGVFILDLINGTKPCLFEWKPE